VQDRGLVTMDRL